jgi:hypothetical protein
VVALEVGYWQKYSYKRLKTILGIDLGFCRHET